MISQSNFDRRLGRLSNEIWSKLAQIEALKGQWVGSVNLSPQILGRLKRSVLITSAGASTRIEGAALSDADVEKLMRGLSVQKFKDRDKQEVRGYFRLLSNVFDAWSHTHLSESMIKHFHKELLKYVDKDERHRGDYKKVENRVEMRDAAGKTLAVVFATTPAYLTPKAMQELMEWTRAALAQKKYPALLVIGHFVVEFLKIHPFQDGNGRLSRVLTNLMMLKASYGFMPYVSQEKLIEDRKTAYYVALRASQKTMGSRKEDISAWLNFFLDLILEQSRLAMDLLTQDQPEKTMSVHQLNVWRVLQNMGEASAGDIVRRSKVGRPTVNQVLTKLLRLKKIERLGLGRSTRYRVLTVIER